MSSCPRIRGEKGDAEIHGTALAHFNNLHRALLLVSLLLLAPISSYAEGKSGVEPQVISLPKGPGSVEGLGESFEPQLNTGTATYRVKIAVSPGVNKHQPEIALEYNSGYGNSPVGLGWDFNTSFIQRRTDKGLPDYSDNDTFTYSKSGDLVPLADNTYRLKVEGLFMRFKKSGAGWEAWEKDGTHLYFGTSTAGRLEMSLGTFKWFLEKAVDTNGNEIRYSYITDNGQVYLDEIRYSIMSETTYKSVNFLYETRNDAFNDYHSRSKVVTAKRLKSIEVRSLGKIVREYHLFYRPDSDLSLLEQVLQYGTDGKSALPPVTFDYSRYLPGNVRTVAMANSPPAGISLTNGNADLIDIDGDSLPDIVYTSPAEGAHSFYLNRGNGYWNADPEVPVNSPPYLLATNGVQMADMDGDGLADLFVKNDFTFGYYKNKGELKWEESDWVPCSPNPNFSFEGQDIRLVDVNNDGLTDVMVDAGDFYYVWLNRPDNQWSSSFDYETHLPGGSHLSFTDQHVKLGDMNGDRMEDLVYVMDGYASYFPSMGNGQFDAEVEMSNPPDSLGDAAGKITLADINNDGFADLVLVGNATITVWFNTGNNGFKAPVTFDGTPEYVEGASAFRFADMNGDGFRDLLVTNEDAPSRFQYVDFTNGAHPNLLTKIANNLGMETTIRYKSSTDFYLADRDQGTPWATKLPFPVQVVGGITVKDLNSGQEYVTDYFYRDGYYDGVEKEFRGFGGVRKVEYGDLSAPTLVTRYEFDVGKDEISRKGMVRIVSTMTESGTIDPPFGLFDREGYVIKTRVLAVGINGKPVSYSFTRAKDQLVYENGTSFAHLSREFDQDDYGNTTMDFNYGLMVGANRGAGKDELLTTNTYYYDLENWVVDRVDTVSKTDLAGNFVSLQKSFYDGSSRWNLIRQESSPEGTTFIKVVRNVHDSYGNITKITDADDHWRQIDYDSTFHIFPEKETIGGLNLSMSAGYDYGLGVVKSFTDFNGNSTSFGYDVLGRLKAIVKPGDSESLPTQAFEYNLKNPVSSVTTRSREVSGESGTYDSIAYYDGLGRKLQTRSEGTNGKWVVNEAASFNKRKGILKKWLPYFVDSSAYGEPDGTKPFTDFAYDAKGRSVKETNPDSSFRSTVYQPLTKVVYDEEDNRPGSLHADTPHTFVNDGLERLVEVRERNGAATYTTRYEYDGLNNLVKITDNEQNIKTMIFDGLGRKKEMNDPDKHHMGYEYYPSGNLKSTTDAKNQTVSYTYDEANRITTENYNGVKVRYHYDSDLPAAWPGLANTKGKLAWVEDEAGREFYSYDRHGNTAMKIREAAGLTFINRMGYDAMDRLTSLTYPDGFTLGYRYNAMNLLDSIPGFVTAIDYQPTGQKKSFSYANGVTSSYGYDGRQRLDSLKSVLGTKKLQDLGYGYDKVSNITAITDYRQSRTPEDLTRSFVYDDLYRLTEAKATGAGWLESYNYSSIGNMTFKSDLGIMTYGANGAGPHALTHAASANIDYGYDANGNISAKTPGFTYGFDHRDRMASAHRTTDGGYVVYTYDYKGNRVTKADKSGATTATTIYADKFTEVRGDRVIKQVFAGDRLVARITTPFSAGGLVTRGRTLTVDDFDVSPKDGVITLAEIKDKGLTLGVLDAMTLADALRIHYENRETRPTLLSFATLGLAFHELGTAAQLAGAVDFYLPDHLGSASVVTDAAGAVVEESVFYPYGKDRARSGQYKSEYRFTGKELDDETGLHYFGQRYYDAVTGRFVSVDPKYTDVEKLSKQEKVSFVSYPQNNNMYQYVTGNPLVYSDLNGLEKVVVLNQDKSIVGHEAFAVEKEGKYYYFSKGPANNKWFSDKSGINKAEFVASSPDELFAKVNDMRNSQKKPMYNNYAVVDTSKEQAASIYNYSSSDDRLNDKYNMFTNNCQDFVRQSFSSGMINTDNDIIPVNYFNSIANGKYEDTYNSPSTQILLNML
jgi:RHS repeat-associated protein